MLYQDLSLVELFDLASCAARRVDDDARTFSDPNVCKYFEVMVRRWNDVKQPESLEQHGPPSDANASSSIPPAPPGLPMTVGMSFPSYDAALSYIDKYGRENGAKFIVRRSESMGNINLRGRAELRCEHYRVYQDGETATALAGEKSRGPVKSRITCIGCMARIKLCGFLAKHSDVEGAVPPHIKVVELQLEHSGHPPKLAVETPSLQESAAEGLIRELALAGVSLSTAVDVVQRSTGIRSFDRKAISNSVYREKERRGLIETSTELENLVRIFANDGHYVRIRTEKSKDNLGDMLQVLFWQTKDQQDFAKSGIADVIACDCTYGVLACDLPILHFIAKNQHGRLIPIAQAVLADETEDTYTIALNFLKHANGMGTLVTLVTDADVALGKAIKSCLPNVAHLLCTFHKQCNLSRPISDIAKDIRLNILCEIDEGAADKYNKMTSKGQPQFFLNTVRGAFTSLVRIQNETKYKETKQRLLNLLPSAARNSITRIFASETQFAACYTRDVRSLGWSASSAAESMHHVLKAHIRNNTNNQRIKLGKLVEFTDSYADSKAAEYARECCKAHAQFQNLPIGFGQAAPGVLGRGTMTTIHDAYQSSKHMTIGQSSNLIFVQPTDAAGTSHKNIVAVTNHQGENELRCDCKLFEREGLPCAHLMAARKHLGEPPLTLGHVANRWKISNASPADPTETPVADADDSFINEIEELLQVLSSGQRELAYISTREHVRHLVSAAQLGDSGFEPATLAIPAARKRGRPSLQQIAEEAATASTSTIAKRIPSQFEQVEASIKDTSICRCSRCKGRGHNARTCQSQGNGK